MRLQEHVSPNHGTRRAAAIDILVLHYTGMDGASSLRRLCDPAAQVSAHYLIDEDGSGWRLVPEERRAWHAGVSSWAGDRDVNSRSIGIELVNPGHGTAYRAFAEAQLVALVALCQDISARHAIPAHRVLGHSDVAPRRKRDPGELFDWKRLARAGIGLWPSDAGRMTGQAPAGGEFEPLMRRFGYEDASPAAVAAFQRHFRPSAITGLADDETRALLADLVMRAGLA